MPQGRDPSPNKNLGHAGSPNKLHDPVFDDEPNQPLFGRTELSKSEFATKSDKTMIAQEGESALYHAAVKLKDQNTKLKNQLKELKVTLKDTLMKVQAKQKQSLVEKSMESRENVLARELDSLQKQLVLYRKEVQTLKNKLDSIHHQDRAVKLENVLKDKNRQIDILTNEKRNLEKIKATQDRELDTFQKEFGYEKKIQNLNEEARDLREKTRKMLHVNRNNEKIFKQQQEYLVALSNQYRIICDKLGVAPSMNFTKAEELNNIITRGKERHETAPYKRGLYPARGKGERSKSVKESREFTKIEPTQENIKKLQATIEALKDKAYDIEAEYAREISGTQAQKKEATARLKDLESRLRDKEKESSILNHRVSELRRMVRFNGLKPLNAGGEDVVKEKFTSQNVVSPGSAQSGRSLDPPMKSQLLRNARNYV